MAVVRQNSFAGGMLSRSLEGRDDLDRRRAGARLIENFIVTPYGSLRKRPGLDVYWTEGSIPGRLVAFRAREQSQYLLAFYNYFVRIFFGLNPNGNAHQLFRLNTPWSFQELAPRINDPAKPGIKWVQDLDRLIVTHPTHAPRVITRVTHENWTIEQLALSATLGPPQNPRVSVARSS